MVYSDECHLLWGNVAGYGWGLRSERLTATVKNPRQRQTYFGGLDALTGEVFIQPATTANSTTTIAYLEALLEHYEGRKVWVIWDNASYHRSEEIKQYLQQINGPLPESEWPLTLIALAPNAPEQNPIEHVWGYGKAQIRKQAGLDSFQAVKEHFREVIEDRTFHFQKNQWYFP